MKKLVLALFVIAGVLVSCNNSKGFTVNVTAKGMADSTKVFLKSQDSLGRWVDLDTAFVKNEKFTFNPTITEPTLSMIVPDGSRGALPIFTDINGVVNVTMYKDSLNRSTFGGSKSADEFYIVYNRVNVVSDSIGLLRKEYQSYQKVNDTIGMQKITDLKNKLETDVFDYQLKFAKEHPDSYVNLMLLDNILRAKPEKIDEVSEIYNSLPAEMKKHSSAAKIQTYLDRVNASKVGGTFKTINGKSPEGSELSLGEVKGKITMIDFWASWCKPCRFANPTLKQIYEGYKNEGFQILGVSVDRKEEDWKKALEEDQLPWPQIIYNNKTAYENYNVNSYPTGFILDSDSKIIAVHKGVQNPEELEEEIANLLGVPNKHIAKAETTAAAM